MKVIRFGRKEAMTWSPTIPVIMTLFGFVTFTHAASIDRNLLMDSSDSASLDSSGTHSPLPRAIYPQLLRKKRESNGGKTILAFDRFDGDDQLLVTEIELENAGLTALLTVNGEYKEELPHTAAEHGDACFPTDNLSTDFCENAYYPQKGRMFCRGPDSNGNYTCECKFAKSGKDKWLQMKYDNATKLCLSPAGGRCYELLMEVKLGPHKFYRKLEESDKQCDNTRIKSKSPKYLKCSKPHPRRFAAYDKQGYYCLRKEDRAPPLHHEE